MENEARTTTTPSPPRGSHGASDDSADDDDDDVAAADGDRDKGNQIGEKPTGKRLKKEEQDEAEQQLGRAWRKQHGFLEHHSQGVQLKQFGSISIVVSPMIIRVSPWRSRDVPRPLQARSG